jgi:hypothetical protein
VVAVPGLLALPLLATIREPARRESSAREDVVAARSVVDQLARHWFVYLTWFGGFSIAGLFGTGFLTWLPEFFSRTHAWPIPRSGLALGLLLIFVVGPGTLAGGWLADWLRARRRFGAPAWISAGCMLAMWPVSALAPQVDSAWLAMGLVAFTLLLIAVPTALAPTGLQLITPNRFRARISAMYLLCTNLIGAGAGPLVVGLFTDRIFRNDAALPESLSLLATLACPAAALLLLAGGRAFARLAASDD